MVETVPPPSQDLISLIINHPLFWVAVMGIIVLFIVKEINKGKLKPEQYPDFGVKYRAKRVKEHLDKQEKTFSIKLKKAFLFRDVHRLGKIKSVIEIPHTNPDYLYTINYRRFGLWNWFISIFGFGKQRIVVDDKNIKSVFNDKTKAIDYIINKDIKFRERGGLMILSAKAETRFIDEINADRDYENTKGFVSDFPRRLSNLHPAHAMGTDSMELENDLSEKTEQKKRFFWSKGGS
jgi:hypothetical protein